MSRGFLLAAIASAVLICGCATNPITGRKELMILPEKRDAALGSKYAPELEKQMGGRIDNATVQNYISSIGDRVGAVSHRPDIEYHFIAVQDKSINAFALPGGYIFITRGLLEKLSSESQLAAILAHEVTHVVARDTAAAMSREIGIAILLAAAASQTGSGDAMTVADITRQILGLRYSRQDERDADIGGLDYMVKAGYNPGGMYESMIILEQQQEAGERIPEFFSTHPSPENRAEAIKERISQRYHGAAGRRTGEEDYRRFVLDGLGG